MIALVANIRNCIFGKQGKDTTFLLNKPAIATLLVPGVAVIVIVVLIMIF